MEKSFRVNERIRIPQVRVIAEDGTPLGVMAPMDALKLAREQGLDLVEVAPMATPPVCRIRDFNKFRYEQEKREREAKKKHHIARLKEIKFKPHIEQHDYDVKLAQLKRFLGRGDNVKVTMIFRGREMAHTELGQRILQRLTSDLSSAGKVERAPTLEGRFMTMVFFPDHEAIKRVVREQAKLAKRPDARAKRADRGLSDTAPQPSTDTHG